MSGIFTVMGRSLRGLRLVEAFALAMLLVMVLGNYLSKASAGRERGEITTVETQIGDEQRRVRLLDAEVAHLEEPQRLQRLSVAAGLGPTGSHHQGSADTLTEISRTGLVPEKVLHRVSGGTAAPAVSAQAEVQAKGPQ